MKPAVYPVVPVVEREVAEHERRVQRVGDEHIDGRVAHEHLRDAGDVADEDDHHKGEALSLPRAARPRFVNRRGPRGGEAYQHDDFENVAPRHCRNPPMSFSSARRTYPHIIARFARGEYARKNFHRGA